MKKQQKLQDLDSTPKDEPAKAQKESPKDLKSSLAAKKKSISHHLLEKFEKVVSASDEEETEEAEQPLSVESSKLEIKDDPDEEMEVARDASGNENVEDDDDEGSDEEESEDEGEVEDVVRGFKDEIVHNSWAKKIKINHDFNEDKPVIADDFKAAFDERKSKQKDGGFLNGWEDCDLPDCFCKEEPHGQGNVYVFVCTGESCHKNLLVISLAQSLYLTLLQSFHEVYPVKCNCFSQLLIKISM